MFDLFGFDPSSLSDAELTAKAEELRAKTVWSNRFGSADLIESLQGYIRVIEAEQFSRWQRLMEKDALARAHATIESDPDLAATQREKAVTPPGKIAATNQPRRRAQIQITKTPTVGPEKD